MWKLDEVPTKQEKQSGSSGCITTIGYHSRENEHNILGSADQPIRHTTITIIYLFRPSMIQVNPKSSLSCMNDGIH